MLPTDLSRVCTPLKSTYNLVTIPVAIHIHLYYTCMLYPYIHVSLVIDVGR